MKDDWNLRAWLVKPDKSQTAGYAKKIEQLIKERDELRQALSQDHGFDRTASHMSNEYVDTAQQAPVARVNRDGFIVETGFGLLEGTLLYTSPPIREWVGLTDEEITEAVGSPIDEVYLADFYKVIAKLKEKNT